MTCPHKQEQLCLIASKIADQDVETSQAYCHICSREKIPYTDNNLTRILANNAKKETSIQIKPYATGTELKKLISWFPVPKGKNCRSCRDLEARMNKWGPIKCQEKMEYIIKKLQIAAKRRKLPFSKRLVQLLVEKAIRNSQ